MQVLPEVHHNPKEEALRRVLLLVGLTMLFALLFAPGALAQGASACPEGTGQSADGCITGEGLGRIGAASSTANTTATSTPSATATTSGTATASGAAAGGSLPATDGPAPTLMGL